MMKKISYLIVLALVLGLIFAGCGDIANITTPSDVDSLEKISLPNIFWTGKGSNALKCELIGTSAERTEDGWIYWVLTGTKGVNDAELVLGGSGSGTDPYEPTKYGSVLQFFTPYFDLDTLTAVVNYSGSLKKNSQFVISDYCSGGSGPTTYSVTFDSQGGTVVSSITDIAYNATITLPAPPAKSGYTFSGWFTEVSGGGTEFTAATPVTTDITVYADWTADGGGAIPISIDLSWGTCNNIPALVDFQARLVDPEGNITYAWNSGENKTVTIPVNTFIPGTYYYYVMNMSALNCDYFTDMSSFEVNVIDTTTNLVLATFNVSDATVVSADGPWKVFTFDGSTGEITPVNELNWNYAIPW